jgi:hypothetical protein
MYAIEAYRKSARMFLIHEVYQCETGYAAHVAFLMLDRKYPKSSYLGKINQISRLVHIPESLEYYILILFCSFSDSFFHDDPCDRRLAIASEIAKP